MALMSRLALIIAAVGAVALLPLPAGAEDGEAAPAPSTIQGLVEDLAGQVSRLIADLPRPRLDVAVVVQGDLPAPPPEAPERDLTGRLRGLLLGAISRGEPLRSVRAPEGQGWDDSDRARVTAAAEGFELLLWIELSLDRNHLVIRGMVYDTERHLWREVVEPERQVVGQLFARARVNAELRWFLGPLPVRPLEITVIPLGVRHYLALTVADLDGDDLNELVLLTRRTLEIRRLAPGSEEAAIVARLRLLGLTRAATRSRDPVGTLAVSPPGPDGTRLVALRTSDHSQGVVVRYDGAELELSETITDFPVRWDEELECTTLRPGRNVFLSEPAPCRSLVAAPASEPYFAIAREVVPQPNAPPGTAQVKVLDEGLVSFRWDGRPQATLSHFGTALALTDTDDDGRVEVLLSSDRDPWNGDELTVVRLGPDGLDPARELVGEVQGSVWTAGAGDADNDGLRELLAVSQRPGAADLLVIR